MASLQKQLNEAVMLIMFNIPKKSKTEKIPAGFIPANRISYVLTELGFNFLATIKYLKVETELIKNNEMISIKEFLEYLNKYITKYTSKENLTNAINYFDMDGDGKIQPEELDSMLTTFSKNEEEYLTSKEIKEIIRTGQKSHLGGYISTEHMVDNLWGTWNNK